MSGIDESKRIHRRTGRTFSLATRLLPERVRRATDALYAFFRVADEVVDRTDDPDPDRQRDELERMRAAALGDRETDDPVLPPFREFGVLLAAVFSAEHHRLVRDRGFDVLTETPELGRLGRVYLLARTWLRWRRHRDQEATIYAVSAVSPGERPTGRTDVPGQPA